jgi:alkylated DNA repair protein (DNA oxidative demethylase)
VHLPGWLDDDEQGWLASACLGWAASAGGFRRPRMPNGSQMSVGIAGLGWHWYPYRYSRTVDDDDGRPVPPFPAELGDIARRAVADAASVDPSALEGLTATEDYEPDVALLNRYERGSRMGLHADREEPVGAPVVSLSVGASARFRFGNPERRGAPYTDVVLESGDAFVFGGPARRAYHGVPSLLPGTGPDLGLDGLRLNVTVRQSGLDAPPATDPVGRAPVGAPPRR